MHSEPSTLVAPKPTRGIDVPKTAIICREVWRETVE
jgi:ABC-type uncharacterized transport system ATPase subunit